MSNKSQSSNPTEPNKGGLPESAERGTGDSVAGAKPVVAGVGVQGAPPAEVLENESPAGRRAAKGNEPAPKAGKAWYRVKGPGSVKVDAQWHAPGAEIQLLRTEALSVDEYLEEIASPS